MNRGSMRTMFGYFWRGNRRVLSIVHKVKTIVHMPHTPLGWGCACMNVCTLHTLHKPPCAKQGFGFARLFAFVHTLHKPPCARNTKVLHKGHVQARRT